MLDHAAYKRIRRWEQKTRTFRPRREFDGLISLMRKTPREIAQLQNEMETRKWLLEATIQELHEFIHHVATHPHSTFYQFARTALEVRISEAAEAASRRLERQTRQLIFLTWALLFLTLGLLILTAVLVKHP